MGASGYVLKKAADTELLLAIRAVIREAKTHQIYSLMQAGQKFGMQTMNQALFTAYVNRLVSLEEALGRSFDRSELESMIAKSGLQAA